MKNNLMVLLLIIESFKLLIIMNQGINVCSIDVNYSYIYIINNRPDKCGEH